jgi:hypothetical protein
LKDVSGNEIHPGSIDRGFTLLLLVGIIGDLFAKTLENFVIDGLIKLSGSVINFRQSMMR